MQLRSPLVLLFDLGNVLVDIDFSRALRAWAGLSRLPLAELEQRFSFDAAYQRHERGEIEADEYFQHLKAVLQLDASHEQIEHGWNEIFVGEVTPTRLLLQQVRSRIPCHAFTNTNASHMQRWSAQFPEVVAALDRIFASHQIGLRKPEPAAFEHICRSLALPPAAILFFDDLAENVDAARAAGLQGVLVRTPLDVADALRAVGVVGPSAS